MNSIKNIGEMFVIGDCDWSHDPQQWHRVAHDNPASLHLHFLEHKGNALQPYFSSSWLALVISGRRVQIGFQTSSSKSTHTPRVLGDSALEEGSWPRYLLDIMPCWHVARGQPIMWERTCYITNSNAWNVRRT